MKTGRDGKPELVGRWWAQVLVAGWVLATVTAYLWLQVMRLIEIAAGSPA